MRFSVFDALGLFAISIIGVFDIIGIFGDELRPALRQSLVCGMFHRPLGSLAEPPYADDDGRNNDHGRNNRNNHIRIHDSSLKSATDTLLSTITRLDRSPTPPYPLSITPPTPYPTCPIHQKRTTMASQTTRA